MSSATALAPVERNQWYLDYDGAIARVKYHDEVVTFSYDFSRQFLSANGVLQETIAAAGNIAVTNFSDMTVSVPTLDATGTVITAQVGPGNGEVKFLVTTTLGNVYEVNLRVYARTEHRRDEDHDYGAVPWF